MRVFRRRKPTPPPCPINGHRWECGCVQCCVFWDTAAGTAAYEQWKASCLKWPVS